MQIRSDWYIPTGIYQFRCDTEGQPNFGWSTCSAGLIIPFLFSTFVIFSPLLLCHLLPSSSSFFSSSCSSSPLLLLHHPPLFLLPFGTMVCTAFHVLRCWFILKPIPVRLATDMVWC